MKQNEQEAILQTLITAYSDATQETRRRFVKYINGEEALITFDPKI